MNEHTLKAVAAEAAPLLAGRALGKVFQLGRQALALDFRDGDGRQLLVSVEPQSPRLYLVRRTVRELEKRAEAPTPFLLALRKRLSGARLRALTKDDGERVVRLSFASRDEAGATHTPTLVAQLTGRSANVFLLDDTGRVVDVLRYVKDAPAGQNVGEEYAPPPAPPGDTRTRETKQAAKTDVPADAGEFSSLSAALDAYYQRLEAERAFAARAAAARARLRGEVEKRQRLRTNLEGDLAAHGDAEAHKRAGDLLLANLANAERRGRFVSVVDYFAEDAPTVEIEVDENLSLPEEAERRFARFVKAKRAAREASERIAALDEEIAQLLLRGEQLESVVAAHDAAALEEFFAPSSKSRARGGETKRQKGGEGGTAGTARAGGRKKSDDAPTPGVRRYRSTDGYDILVGRAARDNDHLTFRVARSEDLWLHAADYPGSHVVVRKQGGRDQEVPHRTLIEAAQIAAQFSQARKDAKVAVHYTPRKFVSKIKGGAPGLVRLASFRTLLVEPREAGERV